MSLTLSDLIYLDLSLTVRIYEAGEERAGMKLLPRCGDDD